MATENDNLASVKLFTDKCGYSKFRTPSILVNPVFAHRLRLSDKVTVIRLSPSDAESLYRKRFSTTEFFPRDIDSVLNNRLSLGTFLAVPRGSYSADTWPGSDRFLSDPPESWVVVSVWNCKEVFTLEVRGASLAARALAKTTRWNIWMMVTWQRSGLLKNISTQSASLISLKHPACKHVEQIEELHPNMVVQVW
ncbi:hypothetical protein ACB092_10G159100 [Castanea dentata]